MNVLTVESVLTAEAEAPTAEELSTRIDAMHDVLTADPSVLSADIITTDGEKIHFLLSIVGSDSEDEDDLSQRADAMIMEAFKAAEIATSEAVIAGGVRVKEFALV